MSQHENNPSRFWPLFLTTILVAVGINLVWALVGMVGVSSLVISNPRSEYLAIDIHGAPYIAYGHNHNRYRRLDGTEIDETEIEKIEFYRNRLYSSLNQPLDAAVSLTPRADWEQRLVGLNDGKRYPGSTTWYIVQDDQARIYFEGFDDATKMPVGFIGRQGYSHVFPPSEQWFQLQGEIESFLECDGKQRSPGWGNRAKTADRLPWGAYFNDGGQLIEVDLRKRTLRTILENIPPATVSGISERSHDELANRDSSATKFLERLALRTADRISILDVNAGKKQDYLLPKNLQNTKTMSVFSCDGNELIMTDGLPYVNLARHLTLYRINPEGEILQSTPVDLAGYIPPSERAIAWLAAPIGPVPLLWSGAIGWASVDEFLQGRQPNLPEALKHWLHVTWPPLVCILLVSLLAAAWVYRSERKQYGAHPVAWSVATLLIGPALLLAYHLERGRPVTTRCHKCRAEIPARRNACAACGAELPAPPITGCEIFAAGAAGDMQLLATEVAPG